MDITNFIDWFIGKMVSLFSYFYSILDGITFHGISLITYSITLIIIGVMLDLLLALPKRERIKSSKKIESDDYEPKHAVKEE